MHGPAMRTLPSLMPFHLVSAMQDVYHQQTKNLLVSYSPKKLGFF
ncbi:MULTISPECIES: hypothetical protein [unclassified Streptomyces]|nr:MULTISPECIES: hypothetical protein [unclassified Streptomyces]